jgi:hypothetical protein
MNVFDNPANAQVLGYLKQKSTPTLLAKVAPQSGVGYTDHTHPELGDLLLEASNHLSGRQTPQIYGFLVLATSGGVVSAIAESTSTLAFLLPEQLRAEAFESGAHRMEAMGRDWVAFDPWKTRGTDQERLAVFQTWCEYAYEYAEKRI